MQHNEEYDITAAFRRIEDELISSMVRNMDRHRAEEDKEGILWSQWQVEQLKSLEKYKLQNQRKYRKEFRLLNNRVEELIRTAHETGNMEQEIEILEAIKNGFRGYQKASGSLQAEFFRLNERKLEALIEATTNDMKKAETAVLRMANDKYRKAIFNAQVYANTGAGTYEKAVDMANKDMLAAGLNCIEYANGARHTLSDYAEMAIRTASKRSYLQGEGQKRQEWGITTVIMNKRGNPCPKCLPFVGKVLIDDVWSGGKAEDGNYPLMSYAISRGLYHPRCKDSHTTYFPGISTADDTWTEDELKAVGLKSKQEAERQYAQRQEEKYGRLSRYSLDEENKRQYTLKREEWKRRNDAIDEKKANYRDATREWRENATPNSNEVIDLLEFNTEGQTYKVDGRHVILSYSSAEKQIAELLKKELGGEIFMAPRVLYPAGISTPDYIFRGKRFDLKCLSGESKNLIYNAICKKRKQADNFILDFTECKLSDEELLRQIEEIYWSKHTNFVNTIIAVRDEKILKIYSRNKK